MTQRFTGKVVIVTGSGTGIGRGIAKRFAAEGASVMLCGRTQATLDAVAAEIARDGGTAATTICDVSQRAQIRHLVAQTVAVFGGLDIVVQNAGIGLATALEKLGEEHYHAVINTNLTSAFWLTQDALPHLKSCATGGRVLITSSALNVGASFPHLSHYAATRGGLRAFIRSAALELAPHNITINAVECGLIEKDDQEKATFASPEAANAMATLIPMKRLGKPADIANAMLFLAAPESSFITGQALVVDGGAGIPHVFTTLSRGRD